MIALHHSEGGGGIYDGKEGVRLYDGVHDGVGGGVIKAARMMYEYHSHDNIRVCCSVVRMNTSIVFSFCHELCVMQYVNVVKYHATDLYCCISRYVT